MVKVSWYRCILNLISLGFSLSLNCVILCDFRIDKNDLESIKFELFEYPALSTVVDTS